MKKSVLLLITCLFTSFLYSQTYNNTWIDYSQNYYKIRIAQEGIYALTFPQTSSVGLSSVPISNIRLYRRGAERILWIKDNNSNSIWDSGDTLYFYAKGHDGLDDAELYASATHQPNTKHSLFGGDTASYFLTTSTTPSTQRYTLYQNTSFTAPLFIQGITTFSEQLATGYYNGRSCWNTGTFMGYPTWPGMPEIYNPEFTNGEGRLGTVISSPYTADFTIDTPLANTSTSDSVVLELKFTGLSGSSSASPSYGGCPNNAAGHTVLLKWNGNNIISFNWTGFTVHTRTVKFPASWLTLSNTLSIQHTGTNSTIAFNQYTISYPKLLNEHDIVAQEMLTVKGSAGNNYFKRYGITGSGKAYFFDMTNKVVCEGIMDADTAKIILNNGGSNQTGFFTVQSQIKPCPNPELANFANLPAGISANYDFIIIAHKSLASSANEYLAYRSTKYNAKLYYIEDIMNEFAFGDFTPLALKRMGKYITNVWNPLPSQKRRHILLLGKCVALTGNSNNNLIPTWGTPASDNIFIGNFDNSQILSNDRLTIGRLTAINNSEVIAYLDKVKAFEQQGAKPYLKNALHLGGGANKWEIDTISHILKNIMAPEIEGYPYGGDVFTHTKDFTKPIVGDIMSTIFNKINNGVGIINFLGHGTTQNWDVAIDDVTKYENKDRYPFIISNGCQTGDFSLAGSSIGENFLKTPEKGAVIYLGGSATTWLGVVDNYVDTLYTKLFRDTSNVPIGDAVQNTLKNYTNVPAPYVPAFRNHARYVCLQGDPSLKLELPTKPDFTIQSSDITILPKNTSLQADSFMVQAVIRNNARAYRDSIQYRIAVNTKIVHQKAYTGQLFNKDTLRIWIKTKNIQLYENNTICIALDYENLITELDETNNSACKSFYLPKNKAIAMYPVKYQIVSTPTVKLIASAENMHTQPNTTFTFQIDTVSTFNSGFLKTYSDVPTKNYQAEVVLPFSLSDSTAYYWRVKMNSNSTQEYWAVSNFTYISGSPSGIAQVHLQQYYDGKKYLLDINPTEKLWTFSQNTATIDINTSTGYSVNGAVGLDVNCCCIGAYTGLFIAVMHPTSLKAWEAPFGGFDCGDNGGFYFNSPAYCFNQNGKDKIPAFINSIPDGYIVFAWKFATANITLSTFNEQTYQAFENIGSGSIRSFNDNESFIIFGRKGASIGSAIEKGYDPSLGTPMTAQSAFLRVVYNTFWYEGIYEYERIGPASSWSSLHWNTNTTRIDPMGDTITYNIYGVKTDGTRTLLKSKVRTYQNTDLSTISANTYPYLDLVANFKDTLFNTAPQLRHNLVFYTGVGDLTLDPATWKSNLNDTIGYKSDIQGEIYVRNVSPYPVDSVWVYYYLENAYSNEKITLKTEKIRSMFGISDSLLLSFSTTLLGNTEGWYDVVIEVNPNRNPLEQYYHNNTFKKRIYIKDDTPPEMKITFDGVQIADKTQVSPNVIIFATLQDNSTRFYLADTSYFEEITLTYPNGDKKPVYFNSAYSLHALFNPGTTTNANTASIQIVHDSLSDGYYTLSIKARDYSQNKISKTVIFGVFKQESGITQIFAFPNPFTDKTQFSFTIQGSVIPDEVFVDIFDMMGRQVNRIFFTNVKHGENISEYAWEGTDASQTKLSSGVYLYKMTAKHQGKEMKVVISDKDKYFNRKGYGKIVFIK